MELIGELYVAIDFTENDMKEYKFGPDIISMLIYSIFFLIPAYLIVNDYLIREKNLNFIFIFLFFLVIVFIVIACLFLISIMYRIFGINTKIIICDDHLIIPQNGFTFLRPTHLRFDEIEECSFVIKKINYISRYELYIKTKTEDYNFTEANITREVAKQFAEDLNKILAQKKQQML